MFCSLVNLTIFFFFFQKKIESQISKVHIKCICFSLNLTPRFRINLSYFRTINWLEANGRVEYSIVNTVSKCWNGNVQGYILEIFKP